MGGAGADEERGQCTGGFRLGGGETGRERQLGDVSAGDQVGEFGEQRGMGEDRHGQQAARAARSA